MEHSQNEHLFLGRLDEIILMDEQTPEIVYYNKWKITDTRW